jgi:tetratricopeptide (TPR) repeat protein
LFSEGFSLEEVRRFCYVNPDFRPVYQEVPETAGKETLLDRLLEFAEQRLLFSALLVWAEQTNPERYKVHGPYEEDQPSPNSPQREGDLAPLSLSGRGAGGEGESPNPTNPHIFLAHADSDQPTVQKLRQWLNLHQQVAWVQAREISGGDNRAEIIAESVRTARQFVILISPDSLADEAVQDQLDLAFETAEQRADGYKVISLILPGVKKGILRRFFPAGHEHIFISDDPGGLSGAVPALLAALGLQLPEDFEPTQAIEHEPIAELLLELTQPTLTEIEGGQRATATARLRYLPPDDAGREVVSPPYRLQAPLGPVELDELKWYIERYYTWPTGVFQDRAKKIEVNLAVWGQRLYEVAVGPQGAQEALRAWQASPADRRFSVQVEAATIEGMSESETERLQTAASQLLTLPWEILHDGTGFVGQGGQPVRVRRRQPNYKVVETRQASLPLRVLLLSPRPEAEGVGYIDHRTSAKALIEAMHALGEDVVRVELLQPPTLFALQAALQAAHRAGDPYDIVHFDGHGVYDKRVGLGALCFEAHADRDKIVNRGLDLVHAEKLAAELRAYGVPLIYLDACQTAQSEFDPQASVAARLLSEGIGSVVAHSHTVLVETSRRFVQAFYGALAQGERVGQAMLKGQQTLFGDDFRLKIMGAGDLRLQDWFVPVLYQDKADPPLIPLRVGKSARRAVQQRWQKKLGQLPALKHDFVGRSQHLLRYERLLLKEKPHRYLVIRGSGGLGKTTLACELARWLVQSGRFGQAAFISVEPQNVQDVWGVLDALGRQLLPQYSVAEYGRALDKALLPVARALRETPTVIVFDNMESVLPDSAGRNPAGVADVSDLLNLAQRLLAEAETCRLIFTSREALPAPFDGPVETQGLGRLSQSEAVRLVERVLAQHGWQAPPDDQANTPAGVAHLVETVNRHPRALVLLAPHLQNKGVAVTTSNLSQLMQELDQKNTGDRENSLYASVELSLRRLPDDIRQAIQPLAVFHSGGHLAIMAMVLGLDNDSIMPIAKLLIDVGMAEMQDYGYLRLDPALPAYLSLGRPAEQLEAWHSRWVEAMRQFVYFLYRESFQDSKMAYNLTLLDLPNLLALLRHLSADLDRDPSQAEAISDVAGSIEALLANLSRPQALAQAVALREKAARLLPDWGKSSFNNEFVRIERLLGQGQLQPAYTQAQALLDKATAAGPQAYLGAEYDLAMAHWLLGRVLKMGGQAGPALSLLETAQTLFEAVGERGERMAAVSLTEQADCLTALGRLDEAAGRYEERIKRGEAQKDFRGVAVGKQQLATVRLYQERYDEALAGYEEARSIFASQNEPKEVATAWHQMGRVHQEAGHYAEAEAAYRQSLALETQLNNRAGQASSLTMLGNLYDDHLNRAEEAVVFYRQAVDIAVEAGDLKAEGLRRNNIADTLRQLKRYAEARTEIQRAIECYQPFGTAVELWKSYNILRQIEEAEGQAEAARQAWLKARAAYLAYRRQGGYAQGEDGQLIDQLLGMIQQGQGEQVLQFLNQAPQDENTPRWIKNLAPTILAILTGQGDETLADDPALTYNTAAEVLWLLERVASG